MLLKLAHISYNSDDTRDMQAFLNDGFEVRETYHNVENPPIKKLFLSHYSKTHDLCILRKDGYADIEIVSQSSVSHSISYVKNVINAKGITEVSIRTGDIESSFAFWKSLGFRNDINDTLLFPQMLPRPELRLTFCCQQGYAKQTAMDAHGFYSVAFLSHNVQQEWKRFIQSKYTVTEINTLALGGNLLRVFFVFGKQNELVEIYDINPKDA